MKYVLDSCALIAFIRDEDGADVIEQILRDGTSTVMMHAINVCEVYYDCVRTVGKEQADRVVDSLTSGNVIIREDMSHHSGSLPVALRQVAESHWPIHLLLHSPQGKTRSC